MTLKLPPTGFVYWPVGTGDSTTICVKQDVVIQMDIHHLSCSEDPEDKRVDIVDKLVDLLPKRNGKPYLPLFILTHPDQDHCKGFKDLLKKVFIGELWFSPRIFREYHKDLCDDASAFKTEAERRVRATIQSGGEPTSGNRVRIIGYDDLLHEKEFIGFPKNCFTVPGHELHRIDGAEYKGSFRAFIHAPFKDSAEGETNETSIAMQITLQSGPGIGKALFLGDHCYPTVKKVFDISAVEDVSYNVLLTPHHCSKSVMFWQDEGAADATLKQDLMDELETAADAPGYIVASSEPIPSSNSSGDNPPHAKAMKEYLKIVPDDFICTQEHPSTDSPQPVVFVVTNEGLKYIPPSGQVTKLKKTLSEAASAVYGSTEPPPVRVGFGAHE